MRDEEALTGEQLPLQAAKKAPFHPRVHLDGVGHEHHRARLGTDFVARIEREDDRLHVVADDLVCDHGISGCRG
jgi:hypothetical protein